MKVAKKARRVPLHLRLHVETASTVREIARLAEVSVSQVVTVILATRIVTERKARADGRS